MLFLKLRQARSGISLSFLIYNLQDMHRCFIVLAFWHAITIIHPVDIFKFKFTENVTVEC